ncbi:MAG: phosphoribosylanthranilate isomerase [Lachnospira sp.]
MSGVKIKICGLMRSKDIEYVNEFMPDYIGFVFAKSKRQIDFDTAKRLKEKLDKSIKTVGVFVDEDIETIAQIVNEGVIELVQLHGSEDESYILNLRQKLKSDTGIIKAVRVNSLNNNILKDNLLNKISTNADFVLLDSGAGSGEVFDWDKKIVCNKPVFLAGGLNEYNVSEAIKKIQPFAVDVSSGVETAGFKDIEKIRSFIKKVKTEK